MILPYKTVSSAHSKSRKWLVGLDRLAAIYYGQCGVTTQFDQKVAQNFVQGIFNQL